MKLRNQFASLSITLLALAAILGGTISANAAELSAAEFLNAMDAESARILNEESEAIGVPLSEIETTEGEARFTALNNDGDSRKKAEWNALIGVGFGLVDRFGMNAVVLRRSPNGKPTWFVQGDLEYLRARLGYAPNDLRLGVGFLPFRRSPFGVALKLTRSSYSDKLGLTPQLSHRIYPGKRDRVAITLQGAATAYFGEENANGRNYSILPDVRIGIAFRILPSGPR